MDWIYSKAPLEALFREHEVVGIVESVTEYEPERERIPPVALLRSLYRAIREIPSKKNPPSLKQIARARKIPYFILHKTRQELLPDFVRARAPEIICVCSMAHLLKKEVFSIPPRGVINLHGSLLPQYRGPSPWLWQYLQMDLTGGLTVHFIDAGIDSGNILRRASYPISVGMGFEDQINSAAPLAAELLLGALKDVAEGKTGEPQSHLPCPLYARFVDRKEPLVDWQNWPIERVWHAMRGALHWLHIVPRPRGWRKGLSWRVEGFSKEPAIGVPGSVVKDEKGYHAVHPQGKIFLSVNYGPLRTLDFWKSKLNKDAMRDLLTEALTGKTTI